MKLKNVIWLMAGICFAISIALGAYIMVNMNRLMAGKASVYQLRDAIWLVMEERFSEFSDGTIPLDAIRSDLNKNGQTALVNFDVSLEKSGDTLRLVAKDKKTKHPRGTFTKKYDMPSSFAVSSAMENKPIQ